ncbi:MAG: hypothetical protein SWE60_06415 [Thermodesulfobacteriota bacterium]|nr:hypothetical protein [Thermodesulfobacteriota bacterium]
MSKRIKYLVLVFIIVLPFVFLSSCHAKPPKPGPHFVWVEPHVAPQGHVVPGHWKYTGPPKKAKAWVPGHHDRHGAWVPGHWKNLTPPKANARWVPGHHGPKGRWIPGHWK